MSRRFILVAAVGFALLGACFENDANLTESGEGKPELSLSFPESTMSGSTEVAELTILNPGPGEMESLVVAFSRLGDPRLPPPIVDVSPRRGRDGAVQDVSPPPRAVSPDGIIYTFDGLGEGEQLVIEFTLRIPLADGPAGNAILVYEGQDPGRARGVRLETEVGG